MTLEEIAVIAIVAICGVLGAWGFRKRLRGDKDTMNDGGPHVGGWNTGGDGGGE